MIQALKTKLTLLVLGLFLLIYVLGGAAALLVFYHGLTIALDEEILDLSSEIIPAIKFSASRPTLKQWADAAKTEHLAFPAGIQIFDQKRAILESYGLSGKELIRGELIVQSDNQSITLKSNYHELRDQGKAVGFLQIQMSTVARDNAVRQFGLTMIFILPFLAVAVTLAGYYFAGLAIQPVEKSIKVLKTFVADAGHEFITPVTVVEASVQTLEETLKEHGVGLDVLSIIGRASQRMKELASDLIFLAKMDNPDGEMPQEQLTIDEVLEPALEEVLELARSRGISLIHSPIPDLPIYGNRHSLEVMITNLLSNAIKYTDAGGSVKVEAMLQSNKVVIVVEDTGIGIPEENISHIFDRFYRVDQSRSRAQGGSGLGLAIVKAILDLHKSEIEVQSHPGKGSVFTVRLPALSIRK